MFNHQFLLMSGEAAAEGGSIMDTIISFAPILIVVVVFYFMLIRPQQKENLEIGDEIATVGGIVGNIVSIKEDTIVIETGSDRSKIRILKGAVAQVREKA